MYRMQADIIRESQWVRHALLVGLGLFLGVAVGLGVAAGRNPLLPVAALAGLIGAIAVVWRTQNSLLAFIGLAIVLPFAVIPVPLGPVKLTFIDAILTALLLMWVLRLLARPEERLQTSSIDGLVLLFILLALVSFSLGSGYQGETVRLFLKIINSILLFFSVINCVRTRQHLRELTIGLLVAGTTTSVIGIVLWLLPHATTIRLLSALRPLNYPTGPEVLRFVADTETLRATSTSVDPNVLGAALMLCLAVAAGQLLSARPALPKHWLVPMVAAMGTCFVLTLSRSSWIGLAASLVLLGTLRYRRLWAVFAAGAAALYFGTVPFAEQYISHLQSGLMFQDQAAAMRLGEYKDAIRLIQQYPWFGVGFGEAPDIDLYIGASSIYLEMAQEMGLVGTGVFLITMALLLWKSIYGLFEVADAELQGYLTGWTGAIVSALVAGTADHHFFNLRFPHTVALFWLLAALALVTIRIYRQSRVPRQEDQAGPGIA